MTSLYFTSKEQSRDLLEMGLPWSSADCYFDKDGNIHVYTLNANRNILPPCWSTGRLIRIYLESVENPKLYDHENIEFPIESAPIDTIIEYIQVAFDLDELNFSLIKEDMI